MKIYIKYEETTPLFLDYKSMSFFDIYSMKIEF